MVDETKPPTREAYENLGYRPKLATRNGEQVPDPPESFALAPMRILSAGNIPHRQWLYGRHLIRGFVTLLVAPGGTGKSSMLLAMCLELATGRSLLGERIYQRCNAALLNLEDPQDEIDRRITALATHYGITNEEIEGRLFASPAEQVVTIAATAPDGSSVWHPHEKQIIERVRDERIGLLAVDPFAESHTLEENSNPQMIQAAAAWRRVARAGDCAVILAHHVRKGQIDSIEAARGAKALTDSARIGLLLSSMTEEDASDLGISLDDRLRYVRLDDAKANMSARAPKASWFQLSSVTLDNADAIYPKGDQVGVIEPWHPRTVWESMSVDDCNAVLDRIDAGFLNGARFVDSRRNGGERWAGHVLIEVCGITEGQAANVVKTWLANGVLVKSAYHEPGQRRERLGLVVNHAKRPGARVST